MVQHLSKSFLLFAVLFSCWFFASCNRAGKYAEESNNDLPVSEEIRDTFPEPAGKVSDFEGLFTMGEEAELTKLIKQHEEKTANQVAIVTITNYEPYPNLGLYTDALGNRWGIGKKDKNNGIVIVLGKELREVYVSTGEGISLKDDKLQSIIDSVMIPEYKKERYYEGTRKGLEAIIGELE
jgi:uncharacterized protein